MKYIYYHLKQVVAHFIAVSITYTMTSYRTESLSVVDRDVEEESELHTTITSVKSRGFSNIAQQRRQLPIFKSRDNILHSVASHQVTILVGETGSGKTTQIPQFLDEAGWTHDGRVVACTQVPSLPINQCLAPSHRCHQRGRPCCRRDESAAWSRCRVLGPLR